MKTLGLSMARDRRTAEELTIPELEALLARKRRQSREARLHQFQRSGRALQVRSAPQEIQMGAASPALDESESPDGNEKENKGGARKIFNSFLLLIEILAVLGLAFVLFSGVDALKELNRESAAMLGGNPTPTALISAVVLPSGHTPPTSPGGSQPNEAEIPEGMRRLLQSMPSVEVPTPGPEQARNIFIPAIWNAPAPVVQGDGWEQLKRGVGQHIGSANPGENGNVVLSAHNDIFGQLFRDLDQLKPGDEILISTASRQYTYRVTGISIVEPTDVSVMEPTPRPTVTLVSCYPYLVDNQRIVVTAELADG
jgi:sortase A